MPKYRNKPKVIEAFRFRVDNCPDWFMDKVSSNKIITTEIECFIYTLEGRMVAGKGDYIIKGIKNEIYSCKEDIFNLTYEEVKEPE